MKRILWLIAIPVTVLLLIIQPGPSFLWEQTVTIHTLHPAIETVAMFSELSDEPDAWITDLPTGTRCKKVDASWYKVGYGDTALWYYKLDCNGMVGYVNQDFVR